MKPKSRKLNVGDWVEVRTKEEILNTLDENAQLDGMPFMPEMFQWCGKRFRVYKRAHKTCDTVFPVRGRRVDQAIHLETRCDGQAHGGCQAGCLIFWKEAWLRPVDEGPADATFGIEPPAGAIYTRQSAKCTQLTVVACSQIPGPKGTDPLYVCQATQLPYATRDLAWWDIRQYIEDYRSGNVGLGRILKGLVYSIYYSISESGIGLGRPMRWFYDKFRRIWRGSRFPRSGGSIPETEPTPAGRLNLEVGEFVRVKRHEEILRTLNVGSRNRGLYWDAEMVPYCGGTYRVLKRITSIIDEKTGRMMRMKNPCIVLNSVTCQARYSHCRMFCPRSIYPYWREIWLERVEQAVIRDLADDLGSSPVEAYKTQS
jgi:hypothetical protein